MLDIATFPPWGQPGTPVLPAAVGEHAAEPALHQALLTALGIDPVVGPAELFAKPLHDPVDPVGLDAPLRGLLDRGLGTTAGMGSAGRLLCLVDPDDLESLVPQLGWRLRTSNSVRRARMRERLLLHELLSSFAIIRLLKLPGLGALRCSTCS
jgi:hypothetical protein